MGFLDSLMVSMLNTSVEQLFALQGRRPDFRFWHIADVPLGLTNVCFEGNNGHDADVTRCLLSTRSGHWYAQSPIHAARRLEANRASLFNHFEWWPLIRSRRRCNSLVYRRPMSWQDARTQSLRLVTPSGGEST